MVTTASEETGAARQPAQPGPHRRRRLARARVASASTTASTTSRAALGIGQLEKLDRILGCARPPPRATTSCSPASTGIEVPLADDADHVRSWFVYVVKLARGIDRERGDRASSSGRGSRRRATCRAIHLQAYMRERYGFARAVPGRGGLSQRTLALPFYTAIEADDQERVVEALDGRPGLGEALVAWALLGLEATAILVTYSRLPPEALYNVDQAGDLAGGLGRTLVLINYPIALAAIALAALAGGPKPLVCLAGQSRSAS